MTAADAAWLVRWTLQGKPRLLPWDMFLTIPERAFELVEPLHGEHVFFTRLEGDQELAVRPVRGSPEPYTCWVTAGAKYAPKGLALDSSGMPHVAYYDYDTRKIK